MKATVVSVVCIVAAFAPRHVVAQAPGSVLPIWIDYDTPPSQVDQLMAVSDAVALVRIESIRFAPSVDQSVGRVEDFTKYDVRVVETLKPHSMLPPNLATLTITRMGGQHTENGRLVRSAVRGFEDFQQNGEYVLFLTWNTHKNDFDIAYGPTGCYQLTLTGAVRPLGQTAVAMSQQGKARDAFLRELRIASAR
jgi:hypothetical protein